MDIGHQRSGNVLPVPSGHWIDPNGVGGSSDFPRLGVFIMNLPANAAVILRSNQPEISQIGLTYESTNGAI